MAKNLTPVQERVLKYIIEYIEKRQSPPTLREIAEHCKYSSFGSIRQLLDSMETKGAIKRTGLSRGIMLNPKRYSVKVIKKG